MEGQSAEEEKETGSLNPDLETLAKVKRSRIRREVLRYLVTKYPEMVSASSMAFELRVHLIDVCGVLHGALPRYREEDSLVALGLAEEITQTGGYSRNRAFYKATEYALSFYKKHSSRLERVRA
jgi:predicted transcriptional regulator with HTH domain